MSRATIAALSLLLAAGAPASALADADQSAPTGCLTYEIATEAATRALESDPDGRLMLFAGSDAAALMKAINDQPPQTDFRADRILVVQRAAKDTVQIGLIIDGCFRGPFAMKEADWEKLKAHERRARERS
jgi:Ni,Fe-hydrogenase III small subunit